MTDKGRDDRFTGIEHDLSGYQVYDQHYEKIGKVDDLFVDENDQPEYIGLKTGLLDIKTTLIPIEMARVNDRRQLVEVAAEKDRIKDGPAFGNDEEMTPEFERRVLEHYGVQSRQSSMQERAYGAYYRNAGDERIDTRPGERAEAQERFTGERRSSEPPGEFRERDREQDRVNLSGERVGTREHSREGRPEVAASDADRERGRDRIDEGERSRTYGHSEERYAGAATGGRDGERGARDRGDRVEGESEIRMQRVEEELRAGTREREAGEMRVRKRVRTDREQVRVPKRREEVRIERVPVEEGRGASEVEIGEDEIVIPVVEEEVVVEKRPVVKEEIRLRKDVVEDEEVVEADVRKEEIGIDDETRRGRSAREEGERGRGVKEEEPSSRQARR